MTQAGDRWLTRPQAADLLGVSVSTIDYLRDQGVLPTHGARGAGRGSILREDAQRVARQRQRAREDRERRQAKAKVDHSPKPPDSEHEWLTTSQAAAASGVSATMIKVRCRNGDLPSTWHDGWRWIRRDLLELRERAREAQASREPISPQERGNDDHQDA